MSNRTEGAFGSEFFNQRVPITTIKDVIEEKQRTGPKHVPQHAKNDLTDTNDKQDTSEHDRMTDLVAGASKTEPQEPTKEAPRAMPGDVVHWTNLPRAKDKALFLVQQGRPLAEVARTVGWTEGTCRSTFSMWKRNKQVAGKPSNPEPFLHEDRFKEIRKLFLVMKLNRNEIIEKYGYAGSCVDDAFYRLKAEKQIDGTARMPMLPGMFDQRLEKPKAEPKPDAPKAEAPRTEAKPGTPDNHDRVTLLPTDPPLPAHIRAAVEHDETRRPEFIERLFLVERLDRTRIVEKYPNIANRIDWAFDRMRLEGKINGTPDRPIVPTKLPNPVYQVTDTPRPLREKAVLKDVGADKATFVPRLGKPVGVLDATALTGASSAIPDTEPSEKPVLKDTVSAGKVDADVDLDRFFEQPDTETEALTSVVELAESGPDEDVARKKTGKASLSQQATDPASILKQLDLLLQSLAMGGAERFDIDLTVKGWNR